LDLKDLYTGKLVKSTKYEGVHEIIRLDNYTMSAWCRPLNSIDFELREIKIEDLKECRRG